MEDFIFGLSPAMQEIRSKVEEVARSELPVLILGETGAGKEALARHLHRLSPRKEGPFEKLDCAQLTPTLFESELLGHEKGAFTGAVTLKKGRLELARHGTLFLDDIGNLEPSMQARLLNILEDRSYYRVGGTQKLTWDFRLICATNADIRQMIEEGMFRQDLYFRVAQYILEIPPLRTRKEDILPLLEHFLKQYQEIYQKQIYLSEAVRCCFLAYHWPGNVRELKNMVWRLVALAQEGPLQPKNLPLEFHHECISDVAISERWALQTLEKKYIELVLRAVNFNKKQAARWLGLSLNGLKKKLARYGIREDTPDRGCFEDEEA